MRLALKAHRMCGDGRGRDRKEHMTVSSSGKKHPYLILFGARRKSLSLGIQVDKSSSYSLHPGVQGPVLIILRVEIILVVLALLVGDDSNIFSNKEKKRKDQWRVVTE